MAASFVRKMLFSSGIVRRGPGLAAGRPRRVPEKLERRHVLTEGVVGNDLFEAAAAGGCMLCGQTGCRHLDDGNGNQIVACHFDPGSVRAMTAAVSLVEPVAALADTFSLHSRPGATKRIFLDFDGHVTSGTPWRSGATFATPAYSLDSDGSSFSDAEKTAIQEIWSRVAEDFSPFDVDVTTEEPTLDDLRKVGNADTRWGIRVVIGGDGSWMSGAAGVAYMNSFNWDSDTPCFVFAAQGWRTNRNFTANCISHEVGHTLGLAHDGYNGSAYYSGRGSGETSWGPIMGNPGSVNLTQWSKGEYGGATNTSQDDLSVIVTRNGFGYRPDDHGGTPATATALPGNATAFAGVVEMSSDVDVFRIATSGMIRATIRPHEPGPNLDILATLVDATGVTVATSNPLDRVGASFDLTVAPGTYYIAVRGTGMGDVNTIGYTGYGSIGQYSANVEVSQPEGPLLVIAATSADKAEGDVGTTAFTFTVTRSGDTAGSASATWSVAGSGTASASAADFAGGAFPSGTVSFGSGEVTRTITVNVMGDTTRESDEGFRVTLASAIGASLSVSSAAGVIRNDDDPLGRPVLAITATSADQAEGNVGTTAFTFTVTRSGDRSGIVSVAWAVSGLGSQPVAADDFAGGTFPSGILSFAAGETARSISVPVGGDTLPEGDESFEVRLSAPIDADLGAAVAAGTVRDDDRPSGTPLVSVASAVADRLEGHSGATAFAFRVTRTGDSSGTSSAAWRVGGLGSQSATPDDFVGGKFPAGTVTFRAGETAVNIAVDVAGDVGVEPNEAFEVILSAPVNAEVGERSAAGMIRNDDWPEELPVVSITSVAANLLEGHGGLTTFAFSVTRAGNAAGEVSVAWQVGGVGDAPADAGDFGLTTFPSGTLTFAPGETRRSLTVAVAGDTTVESDERFRVTLSAPVGATLQTATATGTIRNDDAAPLPSLLAISALVANLPEGNVGRTPLTFRVSRRGPTTTAVGVHWAVSGSGPNPADAADFLDGVLPSGWLGFAAGEITKTITVLIAADVAVENDETFVVTLSDAEGATLAGSSATATIRNDDRTAPLPTLRIGPAVMRAEGHSGTTAFAFQVVRAGLLGGTTRVRWGVAGSGLAPAVAADFIGGALPAGELVFGPGESTKMLVVPVAGDTTTEADEAFSVTLSMPSGATLAAPVALGTIRNDDGVTPQRAGRPKAWLASFAALGNAGDGTPAKFSARVGVRPRPR